MQTEKKEKENFSKYYIIDYHINKPPKFLA